RKESGESDRLTAQVSQLLEFLLISFPRTVTREEIGQRLWPDNPPADLAHSVRIAVGRLREELGDSPEHPYYLETIPQRGYRWMIEPKEISKLSLVWVKWLVVAGTAMLSGVVIMIAYRRQPSPPPPPPPSKEVFDRL